MQNKNLFFGLLITLVFTNQLLVKAQEKAFGMMINKVGNTYFLSVADSLIERDMLVKCRINRAGADVERFGKSTSDFKMGNCDGNNFGSCTNQQLIRFQISSDARKLMVTIPGVSNYASNRTENGLFYAVRNSNMPALVRSFSVVEHASNKYRIDVTDWLNSDNELLFLSEDAKRQMKFSGYQSELTSIDSITNAWNGIDVRSTRTYNSVAGRTSTIEVLTSFLVLPKIPLKPRNEDSRVGYFSLQRSDYDQNPQGIDQVNLITRWRLEPRTEDLERYRKGELVKPVKPIVFYIDPAMPKKWVPYFIQGVNDWQAAFEKAGFKEAIIGKVAPSQAEDPAFSMASSRYSAIVFHAEEGTGGGYSTTIDPRTGEILESHIKIGPNAMKWLRDTYFIQASPSDSKGRQMIFEDKLMGRLLQYLVAHEVGHTLGLHHNMGASAMVPTEKLLEQVWLEKNGITPSIMDYARFNYVAQPENHVSGNGLVPSVGAYDKFAIGWGYRYFPDDLKPKDEVELLKRMVRNSLDDRECWYGGEGSLDDPRVQSEDLGANAILSGEYGIKNLKRVISYLSDLEKKEEPGKMSGLFHLFEQQIGIYFGNVGINIGGVYSDPVLSLNADTIRRFVPKAIQEKSLQFFNEQLFTTPLWLLNACPSNASLARRNQLIFGIQSIGLITILSKRQLQNLIEAEQEDQNSFKIADLLHALRVNIWTEITDHKTIDIYRANLQRCYLSTLKYALIDSPLPLVKLLVSKELTVLLKDIEAVIPKLADDKTIAHLQDCKEKITEILNPKLAGQ